MKNVKKINLTQLNKVELSEKELNRLLGGGNCCLCGCRGSSSNQDNGGANTIGGLTGLYPGDGGGGTGYGEFW